MVLPKFTLQQSEHSVPRARNFTEVNARAGALPHVLALFIENGQ